MSYVFANSDQSSVIRDSVSVVAWDPVNNQPLDITGLAGRLWIQAGSPVPDPYVAPTQTSLQQFDQAISYGVTLIWTISTTLNGAYAIDPQTQNNITAETVSILLNNTFTNGQATRYWMDTQNSVHQFTIPQFKLFATTIAAYVSSLHAALGGQAAWPSNAITITG
jgi:hypothetical protein